jgi:hypothetical protein
MRFVYSNHQSSMKWVVVQIFLRFHEKSLGSQKESFVKIDNIKDKDSTPEYFLSVPSRSD